LACAAGAEVGALLNCPAGGRSVLRRHGGRQKRIE